MALRKGFANNLFCPRCQQAANDGHPEMGQLLDEVCSLFKHNAHTAVFEKVARIRELDRSNVLMKLTLQVCKLPEDLANLTYSLYLLCWGGRGLN